MEIKDFIEKNLENMKDDLRQLVSFNSVLSDDEKPFGSQNRKVLDKALSLMNDKGFNTNNLDYYCGYGEIGTGDKLVGIVTHLDIVPVGEGWNSDPLTLTEKDGVLYGRGVSDDKGACVASMYAMKYLLDEKYPFKKRIRLITGCNEETGSACMRYYVEKQGHIDYGFTPDGDFPGIYAEKGMLSADVVGHKTKIIDIKGGTVSNAVCHKVECELPLDSFDEEALKKYLDDNKLTYEITKNDTFKIIVKGVAAHASTPDLGTNAFSYLMEALYAANFNDAFVDFFHKNFALTVHGEILGYEDLKDEETNTSINFGVPSKDGNDIHVTLDMRFPVKTTIEKVKALLVKAIDDNNDIIIGSCAEPLYFDRELPMIKALKKAYEDVTGDKQTEMEAIGGGTYAKTMHNCIAFGCEFPRANNHIHDVNESLIIDELKKQVEIYAEAIRNLNEI